ncbi:MAG: chemotaxis protein CheB [Pseudomonadota bacterium]
MQRDDTSDTATPIKPTQEEDTLFLVGIGASAGGLEAIRDFVKNLPESSEAAYVIVQHLSPDHQSLLTTLIDRETHLKVVEVKNGMPLEAHTIHVTPPNRDVVVRKGELMLERPSMLGGAPKPSVDRFFRSAAEHYQDRAVGIILSGTGSDGSYGLQAIQSAGGITIAQDDKTAKYDGMPMSAVETGCVDIVLPPEEIARHLNRILSSPRDLKEFKETDLLENPLSDLLHIVLAKTRVDFRDYKQTTIRRRIERRMTAIGIASLREYTNHCRQSPAEVTALFKDLLISVTRFFRDPAEFQRVDSHVQQIVENAGDRCIRIWVVGCATGEEVYSIAMLFGEALGGVTALTKDRIQIFATDIDLAALDLARAGVYSRAAIPDIDPKYFDKYVHHREGQIFVDQRLKDVVLFSNHNICQDPPFTNVDLVCCRNLLIYFEGRLQERVLSRLNYALVPNGYMFLGKSETVNMSEGLFDTVDQSSHLFRKRVRSGLARDVLLRTVDNGQSVSSRSGVPRAGATTERDVGTIMFELLASRVGPNSILLDRNLQIARVFGDVSRFSVLTDRSRLKFDISLLRPELAIEARSIAAIALKNNAHKQGTVRTLESDPGYHTQLECFPLQAPSLDEDRVLLIFRRWPQPKERKPTTRSGLSEEAASHIEALEQEITRLQEEHQQTLEELETTNEELQTTIEEYQSTNEELQSTNEEIETSNEELQSTNEELITVNEELQISTYEMNELNDEQSAVLESVVSPLLIVDVSMHITKANKSAINLMNLKHPIDRPHLSQCRLPKDFPALSEICSEAYNLGHAITRDVVTDESVYTLECAPYFNGEAQLRGATLMFHRAPELVVSRLAEKP